MGFSSLAHMLSSAPITQPSDRTSYERQPTTTASSESFQGSEPNSAKVSSLGSEPRSNILRRIFSSSSNKDSPKVTSSFKESPVSLGKSLRTPNEKRSVPLWTRKPSPRASSEKDPALEKKLSLVPPNYVQAFQHRIFPLVENKKGDWARNLVSCSGNGIRVELADMYNMFSDMEKRPTMLTMEDVELFVSWFTKFLGVLSELFELEETCLYPWIEGVDTLSKERRMWETDKGRITGELSAAKRVRRKGRLITLGREIEVCHQLFERRPVAEGLPALAETINVFVDELMDYIEAKEQNLPTVICRYLSVSDRSRFENMYWSTAIRLENHVYTFISLSRWMDKRQLRKWKRRVFGVFGYAAYTDWKKTYYVEHHSIVFEFSNRVCQSEAERMAQVEENEATRARAQFIPTAVGEEYSDSEAHSVLSSSCASGAGRSHSLQSHLISAPACVA